ncbi:protein PLASTID REDOX INSENSITIVE 2, chloroplastic-like [Andrographis paniculata]|uniref:protein PLASTID REDOX INSENSITIVE 2, chloroplastic-like n=1 Tax=Andrographis paniculata TaxID=175694 RepID=UPI0021E8B2AB|nr:protein PLASTID REDOX INSENSITIVE 2, chloroplastic-like [Andrographis paniculata]
MAVLSNPAIILPVRAFPAKNPSADSGILRNVSHVLCKSPSFFVAKPFLRLPQALASQKYAYPDPIPEFAVAETRKFKRELLQRLSKEKDTFGNDLQTVVDICAEIFSDFLHEEYGGPGTLLIEPFTDMMVALKEKNLPGAPLAARASLLWAQNYVDQDWEIWRAKSHK